MHWLCPLFYTVAKFGPLEKALKTIRIIRDKSFLKNLFDH